MVSMILEDDNILYRPLTLQETRRSHLYGQSPIVDSGVDGQVVKLQAMVTMKTLPIR